MGCSLPGDAPPPAPVHGRRGAQRPRGRGSRGPGARGASLDPRRGAPRTLGIPRPRRSRVRRLQARALSAKLAPVVLLHVRARDRVARPGDSLERRQLRGRPAGGWHAGSLPRARGRNVDSVACHSFAQRMGYDDGGPRTLGGAHQVASTAARRIAGSARNTGHVDDPARGARSCRPSLPLLRPFMRRQHARLGWLLCLAGRYRLDCSRARDLPHDVLHDVRQLRCTPVLHLVGHPLVCQLRFLLFRHHLSRSCETIDLWQHRLLQIGEQAVEPGRAHRSASCAKQGRGPGCRLHGRESTFGSRGVAECTIAGSLRQAALPADAVVDASRRSGRCLRQPSLPVRLDPIPGRLCDSLHHNWALHTRMAPRRLPPEAHCGIRGRAARVLVAATDGFLYPAVHVLQHRQPCRPQRLDSLRGCPVPLRPPRDPCPLRPAGFPLPRAAAARGRALLFPGCFRLPGKGVRARGDLWHCEGAAGDAGHPLRGLVERDEELGDGGYAGELLPVPGVDGRWEIDEVVGTLGLDRDGSIFADAVAGRSELSGSIPSSAPVYLFALRRRTEGLATTSGVISAAAFSDSLGSSAPSVPYGVASICSRMALSLPCRDTLKRMSLNCSSSPRFCSCSLALTSAALRLRGGILWQTHGGSRPSLAAQEHDGPRRSMRRSGRVHRQSKVNSIRLMLLLPEIPIIVTWVRKCRDHLIGQ
ncbi:hypothetical protein DFJ74DRAFT_258322 [Hyaloraphidium curvatum]|nr:hypothetical protein DFJ74DRAFT_258322 [Hyaloraphidium curvatum]